MTKQSIPIHQIISQIINKTAGIHFLTAQIISYYYLGNDSFYRLSLIHDILTNEQTSLSFITNSLKNVLLNLKFPPQYVKEIKVKMLTLGNLRNKFAHEVLLFNQNIHWLPDRSKVPYKGEGLNTETEFLKFNTLYNDIFTELNKIIKDKNIKMIDKIPDKYEPPTQENTSL